ncbi:MAG: hypothetical protein RR651_09625 [Lysinibacillus sp.]
MKTKVSSKALLSEDDIWNAMLSAYGQYNFPTDNEKANDVFIVFNYFCELESGGHESLFNWLSEHIEKMGITTYLNTLTKILGQIGADHYAKIEMTYGKKLWEAYIALENSNIKEPDYLNLEADFYKLIEKADGEYRKLGEELGELLQKYAVTIYTEIIEVVEE